MQNMKELAAAMKEAGYSAAEVMAALAEANPGTDASAEPAETASPTHVWRSAVIAASEGFDNGKGYQELMVPGTVRIVDGDEKNGTVIGRDAKRPDEVALRVGKYRRNRDGEYRVKAAKPGTEGEIRQWLAWHEQIARKGGKASSASKATTARKRAARDTFDPNSASKDELREYAKAHGIEHDGRWGASKLRKAINAARN